jgi:sugar phosphate isomerase/epimerase
MLRVSRPGRLPALSEGEFEAVAAAFRAGPVRVDAANSFLPADLPLAGPDADPAAQDRYVDACLARMERVVVFGSGRARAIPDGVERAAALDQLEGFMRRAAGRAAAGGVTLVLEPLRSRESNVFNSVREGAAFLRERKPGTFRLLADLYHLMEEGEDLGALDDAADLLAHAHVADGARRTPGRGEYDIAAFLARPRAGGYPGDVSVECRWDDFGAEVGPAFEALRRAV